MHECHATAEPDELFETGSLKHLVPGNEGRVLDGRRTPGYIESFDPESCMFIWRITAFEDAGKCWEIPAEQIEQYQFRKSCSTLSRAAVEKLSAQCKAYQKQLTIPVTSQSQAAARVSIAKQELQTAAWLKEHSRFIQKGKRFDFHAATGDPDLYCDLEEYMRAQKLYDLEQKTASQYLLNPYSGEWIKGMKIVMAEAGLISYSGSVPRTPDIFQGIGAKELRWNYILARTAFLRSVFKLSGILEVPLYRGMASSSDWIKTPPTLLSATFSADTAKDFCGMDDPGLYRSCYWIKFFCPVENLFMTFYETKELNERYKEQEAIIYYQAPLT
ncbi:hypothetical protein [Parablautia sp. Marseille-Q6255]|uniref:hypothetical protein n=1 Tax=Parablautia sp. Marseille-Q6255 TaxID=3039593 RepID=UPI0024BC5FBB|nr:hypothetical protein [Parablautia sp. Marseille-Q6255]